MLRGIESFKNYFKGFEKQYTIIGGAAVAISGNATFNGLPDGTYKDLYNDNVQTFTDGRLTCNTPSSGVCIFVKQ